MFSIRHLVTSAAICLSLSVPAFAQSSTPNLSPTEQAYLTIDHVEVHELSNQDIQRNLPEALVPLEYKNDCSVDPHAQHINPKGTIDWDQIVAIGEKVWKIIEDNKPVVEVKMPSASALPKGVMCWTDLEHWQPPNNKVYAVEYKNLFGMTVVDFKFRLTYTYGGGFGNLGKYLANVTVTPVQLDVLWGYKFNAETDIANVVNLGTKQDPEAGMQLTVNWKVSTVMKESHNSVGFFVRGNGGLQTAD